MAITHQDILDIFHEYKTSWLPVQSVKQGLRDKGFAEEEIVPAIDKARDDKIVTLKDGNKLEIK
jgi:hypothetical protein